MMPGQERYRALQEEAEATRSGGAAEAAPAGDPADLAAQNARLKEALRRLQAVSTAEAERHGAALREALATAARDALAAQSEAEARHAEDVDALKKEVSEAAAQIAELSQVSTVPCA